MTAFAGRFAITGLLGSGATASVYSARDSETDATLAVKVLHPQLSRTATERSAFFAEAAAAGRVDHPGVPAVVGHGIDDDGGEPRAWIATSLAPGRTLARRVDADGPLEPVAALAVAARLLDALAAVHAAGLVHRDVAPGNVVVADDGAVSLLDFGLADAPGRPATGADVLRSGDRRAPDDGVIGSVNYLSPEQAIGAAVDERGDLYQVAGVLHFALTGRPPFPRATTAQTMAAHVSAPPPVPSALDSRIPPAVDELVVRGLMKDPAARHPSAATMAAHVRALLGESDPASAASVAPAAAGVAAAAPSVFVGPEGVLVDRDAATAVLPRGRGRGGVAGRPKAQPGIREAGRAASPGGPKRRASGAPAAGGGVAASATASVAGSAAASGMGGALQPAPTSPSSPTSRTALAVTAGAVAVAATIWLVAANAAPTAPPPAVAITTAPPVAPTVAPTPVPTVAPVVVAPQASTVPGIAGLARSDALARLAAAGLAVGAVSTRDGTAAQGSVLESAPAAGSTVAPGTAVALVVASGRNAVPDVHGGTLLAAGATLTAAGFAVAERAVVDSTVAEGTVLGTEPGAGTVIALGEPVTVVVTRLPARPVPTPTPTPSGTATPSPTRPPSP